MISTGNDLQVPTVHQRKPSRFAHRPTNLPKQNDAPESTQSCSSSRQSAMMLPGLHLVDHHLAHRTLARTDDGPSRPNSRHHHHTTLILCTSHV